MVKTVCSGSAGPPNCGVGWKKYCNELDKTSRTRRRRTIRIQDCEDEIYYAKEIQFINKNELCSVWEIGDRIGEDSFNSQVFNSHCRDDGKIFAFKYIKFDPDNFLDEEDRTVQRKDDRKRILNEINIQMKASKILINGATITPKIYEIFEFENHIGVIMEIVGAITLKRYLISNLKNKKIVDEAKKNTKKILDELHKAGIYHGDAHLNNFMFDPETKEYKILDFGNSKKYESVNLIPERQKNEDHNRLEQEFNDLH
jgi:serine/threonine protein kinase